VGSLFLIVFIIPNLDAVSTCMCLLGLTQETTPNNKLLDLVFTNFDSLRVSFVDMGMAYGY
jgi:hypothetical protein